MAERIGYRLPRSGGGASGAAGRGRPAAPPARRGKVRGVACPFDTMHASGKESGEMILLWFLLAAMAACAQTGGVEVWAVPSVHKVRPDERKQSSNLVWDGKTKTVSVAGAKNEHIPFQVVVSAPPPPSRYERAATGFFVSPATRSTRSPTTLSTARPWTR